MTDDMTVDVSEVLAFARTVESSGPRLGAAAAKVIRDTAEAVETTMRGTAPVETGDLRDSIGTDYQGDGRSREFTAIIGPTVDYARFVQHGTAFMAPNPFATRAADAHADEFNKAMDAAPDKAI